MSRFTKILLSGFVSLSLIAVPYRASAQEIATAVQFTKAKSATSTEPLKLPYGSFVPLFATTDEPTEFDISDSADISTLVLPQNGSMAGIKYDIPGVKGWNFPNAKSEILIVICNNSTDISKTITVNAWANRGVGKKPAKTGSIVFELLPEAKKSKPIPPTPIVVPPNPTPIVVPPVPVPVPDPTPIVVPEPITYTGKYQLLVIEESSQAVVSRGDFFRDQNLRAWFGSKLLEEPRVIDKDAKTAGGSFPKDLQPYFDIYKTSGKSLPYYFLVAGEATKAVPRGKIIKEGTMPTTNTATAAADFLTLLSK